MMASNVENNNIPNTNHFLLIDKLKEFFPKYNSFRGPNNWQENAIVAALNKKNILICQKTGSGKSLAFQLPAFIEEDGFTLVISPLLALMKDQVQLFGNLAAQFTSETEREERNRILTELLYIPTFRLLYVSPEQFDNQNSDILYHLQQNKKKLKRIVIDEAQCIFTWGLSFRAAYRTIWQMFDENSCFASIPRTAVTASGSPKIRLDIIHMLRMDKYFGNNDNDNEQMITMMKEKEVKIYINSFNRSNIKYICINKEKYITSSLNNTNRRSPRINKYLYIKKCLDDYGLILSGQSGIIYCRTRKESELLAKELNCAVYHAGLSIEAKDFNQRSWMLGKCKIICATIAFGLGIHKPDVRFIIHTSPPQTLEAYYQESGRGGRDGFRSLSFLFYCEADFQRHRHFVENDKEDKESTLSQWTSLPELKDANRKIMGNVSTYFKDLKEDIENMRNYCNLSQSSNDDDNDDNNNNCSRNSISSTGATDKHINYCRRAYLLRQFDEIYEGTCHYRGDEPCDICDKHMDIVQDEADDETKDDIDIFLNSSSAHYYCDDNEKDNTRCNTIIDNNANGTAIATVEVGYRDSKTEVNSVPVASLKDCQTKIDRLKLIQKRMASSSSLSTRKSTTTTDRADSCRTTKKSLSQCETKEDRLALISERMGKR
jgi:ATP-dependent DNA helicase RecQ